MNKYIEHVPIPSRFKTIEEKLKYLNKLSYREQELDRMDMDYSFRLFKTIEYFEYKLNNQK